jgi:CheY-like chemotaxis protein
VTEVEDIVPGSRVQGLDRQEAGDMTERVTTLEEEREQALRKHILGINGHPPFLELLREILQAAQYNVTTTNDVPQTYYLITALQPDLVIVDLVLSQTAGWELLERLHQDVMTSEIPLLLTSTDPRLLDRAQAEAARYGAHPVLACPFGIDALLQAIEELIGNA